MTVTGFRNHLGILLILVCFSLSAQDRLVKTDSTVYIGKIQELSDESVKIEFSYGDSSEVKLFEDYLVAYIVLENGYTRRYTHAVQINSEAAKEKEKKRVLDSVRYYRYSQSLAVNYLAFFNRELNMIYSRDYYNKHLMLQLPVSVGFDFPRVTGRFYFRDLFTYTILHKIFDAGIACYYTPSYNGGVNFLIGPMYKMHFYRGQQVLLPNTNTPLVVKNSVLMRNALGITTGLLIRTKSRLSFSGMISMGGCHDAVVNKIVRPGSSKRVDPIGNPLDFYFWAGATLGYSF